MSQRPFRFGVQAMRATSGEEWRDLVHRVEGQGYSTLFLADHYLGRGPAAVEASQVPQHIAPLTAMAVAAALTTTLRVGSRVFCMDYHVPAALVKEVATLDMLCDGRVEFGIGAGWSEVEYRAMGLTFAPAPQRVAKLKEIVALFKAHCSGDELDLDSQLDFDGELRVVAKGYTGLPLPAQRPHPPIMIGGGRKGVLSFAAREADIVSINNVHFSETNDDGLSPTEEAVRRLSYVREAGGERFSDLDIESSPFFTKVTDDPAAAVEKLAAGLGVPGERLLDHPNVLIGPADELIERLQARREELGVNYVTIQQMEVDDFAPVVSRLNGT